jgi:Arc/MetJ-type ribon-helix-helix transcriptional regulator
MNEDMISIRLSKWDIKRIQKAVEEGFFTNRSDFIRSAVRKLADELDIIPDSIKKIRSEASRKGITHEDAKKWSKEAGKKAHRRKGR